MSQFSNTKPVSTNDHHATTKYSQNKTRIGSNHTKESSVGNSIKPLTSSAKGSRLSKLIYRAKPSTENAFPRYLSLCHLFSGGGECVVGESCMESSLSANSMG